MALKRTVFSSLRLKSLSHSNVTGFFSNYHLLRPDSERPPEPSPLRGVYAVTVCNRQGRWKTMLQALSELGAEEKENRDKENPCRGREAAPIRSIKSITSSE